MRLLLIGNYKPDEQQSMRRYSELLLQEMRAAGNDVRLLVPPSILNRLIPRGPLSKWIGYLDKYCIFPFFLRWISRRYDWIHVCDHSNSVYLPHLPGRRASITCHDVLAIQAALGVLPAEEIGRRISVTGRIQQRWISRNLIRFEWTVCVSRSTEDALRKLGARGKLWTIPNPLQRTISHASASECATVLKKYGLDNHRYFLHVGGNQWYKNRAGVLRIFAELRNSVEFADTLLALAGKPMNTALLDIARELSIEDSVREIISPSDEELDILYRRSEALLFPSLREGFGWPIIEAQANGTLVITSAREPMQEIAGDAAILVDPVAPVAASKTIREHWTNRAMYLEAGARNVSSYSKEIVVQCYRQFFRTASGQN